MFEQKETLKSTSLIKNEDSSKKETENQPSKVDGQEHFRTEREESEQKLKSKTIIRRSLISPPYSTPRFVFKRVKDFNMQVLASRYSKPLEEVRNDFQQLDPCVEAFLTLGAVHKFEFQLQDTDIFIDLVEGFDKSAEDMSPPIVGILGPLEHIEPTLIIHLNDRSSSSTPSLVNIVKTLELKVVKLEVVGPDGPELSKEEKT